MEEQEVTNPLLITSYAVQTPKERFSSSGLHSKDSVDLQTSIHKLPSDAKTASLQGMPRPATWRMNLVALSQKYNMYFVAYLDTIHITKPQTLKQIMPGVPDMILRLPKSSNAGPGYVYTSRPHCVNNMIIGNLGNKEILLFCCDDGDVTAYYTDLLAGELQQTVESTPSSIPIGSTQPFFLENVGISAWGLAIHQKSRLIAVSSNNQEVVVFVHGTSSSEPCDCAVMEPTFDSTIDPWALRVDTQSQRTFPKNCHSKGFSYNTGGTYKTSSFPLRYSSRFIRRDGDPALRGPCPRNFRIILKPAGPSHNIPAITFNDDDETGLAKSIIATDILGSMWLLEIWQESPKLIGLPLAPDPGPRLSQMGWGVMAIPLRYFKHSQSFQDALGEEDLNSVSFESVQNMLGSRVCLNLVQRMKRFELSNPILQNGATILNSKDNSGYEPMLSNSPPDQLGGLTRQNHLPPQTTRSAQPSNFMKHISDMKSCRIDPNSYTSDRLVILRTWMDSIELIPSSLRMPATICTRCFEGHQSPRAFGETFHNITRINMMALIPELALVIVASQIGRAALLTLSMVDVGPNSDPIPTFRIEGLLPPGTKNSHIYSGYQGSNAPLLGLAVSPIQNGHGIELQAGENPKRWRLIMQGYDHIVWNYELTRDEHNNLQIF
ncbi:hypothetical protein BCIN_06g05590 [Botrytis cinerea B05.10]|uniref:Pyridine nucleotide-disulfide oxidoreductase family protein n=1 Tax=Botryotinia fuckeliana (strain B05.10) TaxID=332648 RepID=A0A384JKK4_BOTFB|nr:hypothetical protein BCIN_06g05590 [Botrytis cinerea B05.10]ATZ51126.1 hypothetical protein BCIN_06g05590 [Botrytis cinerea B05.10]